MSALSKFFSGDGGNEDHISPFDAICHEDEQGKHWSGRELGKTLGYTRWENFRPVIEQAIANAFACGLNPDDHILGKQELVQVGSGAQRRIENFRLTRRGCYLVAINADASKTNVAAAKNYFVIRTRQAELAEQAFKDQQANHKIGSPWALRIQWTLGAHLLLIDKHAQGFWTVISVVWYYMLIAEDILSAHQLRTFESDLMDGSIGIRWGSYFSDKYSFRPDIKNPRVTIDVGQNAKTVQPNLWPEEYRGEFKEWLFTNYFPKHFYDYVMNKTSFRNNHAIAKASAADHVSMAITERPSEMKLEHRETLNANNGRMVTDSEAKRIAL